MQSLLAALSPLPPTATRRMIAASPGLLAGLDQPGFPVPQSAFAEAPGVPQGQVIKDWQKAGGFAAMAIGELLQPIFDTVHLSDTRFGGGAGEQAWKPVLVQAIGEGIAREGGLGLTETVFRELLREQAASVPDPAPSPASPTSPAIQGDPP
ncbi:MAG: rod-binding protein [Acetobacteraceae bacterium]